MSDPAAPGDVAPDDPGARDDAELDEASRRQVEGTPAEGVLDPDADDPVEPGEPG